jgi:Protein of unknown function (DUF2934)
MTEKVKKAKAPAKPRKTTAKKTKAASPATLLRPSREEVEKLAHTYWEQRGCQHGFDQLDWLRAEKTLLKMAS